MASHDEREHPPPRARAAMLPGLDYDVRYQKGAKHQATDALSRLETKGHETGGIDYDLIGEPIIGAIEDEADVLELDNIFNDKKLIWTLR